MASLAIVTRTRHRSSLPLTCHRILHPHVQACDHTASAAWTPFPAQFSSLLQPPQGSPWPTLYPQAPRAKRKILTEPEEASSTLSLHGSPGSKLMRSIGFQLAPSRKEFSPCPAANLPAFWFIGSCCVFALFGVLVWFWLLVCFLQCLGPNPDLPLARHVRSLLSHVPSQSPLL